MDSEVVLSNFFIFPANIVTVSYLQKATQLETQLSYLSIFYIGILTLQNRLVHFDQSPAPIHMADLGNT